MKVFVGLDVSLAKTAICMVSEHGKIVKEAQVASEPEALASWIGEQNGSIAAIGLEAGPLSQWLHRGLAEAGLDVVLMETRQVKGALPEFMEQQVPCCISLIAIGCVHDGKQHGMAAIIRMVQPARSQDHRSVTKPGEIVLDLIIDNGGRLGDHFQKQSTQAGNIPFAVAKLVDAVPNCLITTNFEGLEKGAAGILDAKTFVQHQQRISDGIDNALRLNVAHTEQAIKIFRIHREQSRTKD